MDQWCQTQTDTTETGRTNKTRSGPSAAQAPVHVFTSTCTHSASPAVKSWHEHRDVQVSRGEHSWNCVMPLKEQGGVAPTLQNKAVLVWAGPSVLCSVSHDTTRACLQGKKSAQLMRIWRKQEVYRALEEHGRNTHTHTHRVGVDWWGCFQVNGVWSGINRMQEMSLKQLSSVILHETLSETTINAKRPAKRFLSMWRLQWNTRRELLSKRWSRSSEEEFCANVVNNILPAVDSSLNNLSLKK